MRKWSKIEGFEAKAGDFEPKMGKKPASSATGKVNRCKSQLVYFRLVSEYFSRKSGAKRLLLGEMPPFSAEKRLFCDGVRFEVRCKPFGIDVCFFGFCLTQVTARRSEDEPDIQYALFERGYRGPQQFESILHSRRLSQIPALGASFSANY